MLKRASEVQKDAEDRGDKDLFHPRGGLDLNERRRLCRESLLEEARPATLVCPVCNKLKSPASRAWVVINPHRAICKRCHTLGCT